MRTYDGQVAELQLEPGGVIAGRIACPVQAVPAPGQYLLATDEASLLGVPLFYAGPAMNGFVTAPPLPPSWAPGTRLALRGPLGRGFQLPNGLERLALIAAGEGEGGQEASSHSAASLGIAGHKILGNGIAGNSVACNSVAGNSVAGNSVAKLLPLAIQALKENAAVTLFAAAPLPDLPLSVEAYPLEAAAEASRWADFLAVEVSIGKVQALRELLGLGPGERLAIPGQALVLSAIPCAGLADCGVCAVFLGNRSWKLACKDGPVFDLKDLIA